jgi:hypothetical protein
MSGSDQPNGVALASRESGEENGDPRPAAVSFLTTEHFILQGARSATISESTGRATMFLGSVSGGLVALSLIATATGVGTTFYAFGLVVLPLLAFVGVVTFERALQNGVEDHGYACRIARLRAYYFDQAPELLPYLLSVAPEERLRVQGLLAGRWQGWRTISGMIGVITAVLAGSAAGLLAAVSSDHSLAAALAAGAAISVAVIWALMRHQRAAWAQAGTELSTKPKPTRSFRQETRANIVEDR